MHNQRKQTKEVTWSASFLGVKCKENNEIINCEILMPIK